MNKPRVKMLLWVENPDKGEGGELAHGVGDLAYHAMSDGWSLHRRMNWHDAPNIEAAKAAAQVDYEARILAALEPVTVQEAREEALRDAADKCSLKLAEPWTDTTTIIPHEYTAEVIRRKITALIEKDKTNAKLD